MWVGFQGQYVSSRLNYLHVTAAGLGSLLLQYSAIAVVVTSGISSSTLAPDGPGPHCSRQCINAE